MEAIGDVSDLNRAVSPYLAKPIKAEGVILEAYFRNLEDHVVGHIREVDAIVGCVAWLTSPRILDALASVKGGVSIVVQKEEFLRPDLGVHSYDNWREDLRSRYAALRSLGCWPHTLEMATSALDDKNRIEPVRCAGMVRGKYPAQPRMHHKFLVFCRRTAATPKPLYEEGFPGWPVPYAVWTGSFNFTVNGSNSLENAVFIRNPAVAERYYEEWQNVAWISEPLDWSSRWVQNEWSVT
jgi:phosphatidylserine/phosphatidylglycerophosphate/cardiolipin synthase-like enzyme